ncbi:hypothetical protein J4402_04010 [Candidatus Pacearchaeota archaeon]|nr:hypothetical protein [Candidatus Pacearchaeota archaeon]
MRYGHTRVYTEEEVAEIAKSYVSIVEAIHNIRDTYRQSTVEEARAIYQKLNNVDIPEFQTKLSRSLAKKIDVTELYSYARETFESVVSKSK